MILRVLDYVMLFSKWITLITHIELHVVGRCPHRPESACKFRDDVASSPTKNICFGLIFYSLRISIKVLDVSNKHPKNGIYKLTRYKSDQLSKAAG